MVNGNMVDLCLSLERFLWLWIFFLLNTNQIHSQVTYSNSVAARQNLIKQEQRLVPALYEYVESLEAKIDQIQRYFSHYQHSRKSIQQPPTPTPPVPKDNNVDVESTDTADFQFSSLLNNSTVEWETTANPISGFQMLRRMAQELDVILDNAETNIPEQLMLEQLRSLTAKVPMPNVSDRRLSVASLVSLVRTFQLDVKELTSGKILGLETGTGLSISNCYELGYFALQEKLYKQSIEFFHAALSLHEEKKEVEGGCDKKCLVEAEALLKNLNEAVFQHDTNFENVSDAKDFSKIYAAKLISSTSPEFLNRRPWDQPLYKSDYSAIQESIYIAEMFRNQEKLCRQEYSEPLRENLQDHRCLYHSGGWSTNILAPLKVEVLHKDPFVIQIYDMISKEKANKLIGIAAPDLARSGVVGKPGESDTAAMEEAIQASFHRSSQNSWVNDILGPRDFHFIRDSVSRLTGMDLRPSMSAEQIQVANYASGGQYIPHPDAMFFPEYIPHMDEEVKASGDRLATFMVYLNNVTRGGGTAFPFLGIVAKPVPRSALFWFNLKPTTGEPDIMTIHGGCPVVFGDKWIANKWIRAYNQMFYLKCAPEKSQKNYYYNFMFS